MGLFGAGGDDHPFGAPRGLAGAFEVQPGIGFGTCGADLAGGLVEPRCRRVWPGTVG